jgi:hypothetical protein
VDSPQSNSPHRASSRFAWLVCLLVCAFALLPSASASAAEFFSTTESITGTDPTQIDRLFRDGIASTCGAPKTGAAFGATDSHHYDLFPFRNLTRTSQCITVNLDTSCTATNFIFSGAYLPTFDPLNIITNYLADAGASPNPTQAYSFDIPSRERFDVNVHEITAGAGCYSYNISLSSLQPWAYKRPKITGTPAVGTQLSGKTGKWAGSPTFERQWRLCNSSCSNISGATGKTYTPTASDKGMTLVLRVTATDGGQSSVADSREVGPVN